MHRVLFLRYFLPFLLVLTLSGCGFHLRGDINLPENRQVMYLQGVNQNGPFGAELASVLRGSGVKLVNTPIAAQTVLQVTEPVDDRRVLSVSGTTGKVREYEILVSLNVSLKDNKGHVIIPNQVLSRTRDFTFDETGLLGKVTEEDVLRQEMRRELIQQILRLLRSQAA